MNRMISKLLVWGAMLAAALAVIPAQAADAKAINFEGAIVSRDGNNLLVRSGAENFNVAVTDATKVYSASGRFIFYNEEPASAASLIPGLTIHIQGEAVGSQATASIIKFHPDDLKTANGIQAALAVPQKEADVLKAKVKAQEQVIAAQEQQIATNKQNIDVTKQQTDAQKQELVAAKAEVDKRFGDMADYDVKEEMTLLFDINSATLSDKAKADLQAFAAKAKTYKGYLIQVAGYADATGSASLNQNLSDRRAEVVANYLRQSCDVGISRVLAPVAMSTAKPVAANETAQGKAENRRVVVKIAVNRAIGQ